MMTFVALTAGFVTVAIIAMILMLIWSHLWWDQEQ